MFEINDSILKCPSCEENLIKDINKKIYSCKNNHCFDIAKQGYVNLLISNQLKSKIHGDSPEMLNARKSILFSGYYKSISDLLVKTINLELKNKEELISILDLGCGIGYYLKELKNNFDNLLINYYGIDISKSGIVEACKLDKSINWAVGSTNKLPYLDNSVDILISIFSPFTLTECERVLKKDGLLFVISPNQGHLIELKEKIYPNIILKREDRNELDSFKFIKTNSSILKEVISIKNTDLKSLLLMTPHYWKSSLKAKEELYLLDSLDVSIDIELKTYKYKN